MKHASCLLVLIFISAAFAAQERAIVLKFGIDPAQVPTWSSDDLNFLLHGTMGTEVVPEAVLHAFVKSYPDLFPTPDLDPGGLRLRHRANAPARRAG